MTWLRRILIAIALLVVALVGAALFTALRSEHPVGFQVIQTTDARGQPFAIGVWYPSDAQPWPTTIGGTGLMSVAKNGPVKGRALPLVLISHGNGGSATAHVDLAMALASAGYIVAAPTHPGDNFQDQRGIGAPNYLQDRTQQVRATLDHLLTTWNGREHVDPARIGAFGFSMGGFTVLTAVGATPDLAIVAPHCAKTPERVCDGLRAFKSPLLNADAPSARIAFVPDARIKAAVVAAPGLEFTLTGTALANVRIPVQMWSAELDANVKDARTIRAGLGSFVEFHAVPGAGHLSFTAPCALLRPPELCADPGEFDRKAFHLQMNADVLKFFEIKLKK
ncbi:MAG: dienelactone hydrolase family protein [Pseudomonadota bacterium]